MINIIRKITLQTILLVIIISVAAYFYINVTSHLAANDIDIGFDFLDRPAGFNIIMHLIDYSPASSYLRAFFVGILNTILLSSLAIVFSTILGIVISFACIARNWLLVKIGEAYIEIFKNIPLLLQIFFWYFMLLEYLPQPENSYVLFNSILINIRGIFIGNYTIIPELSAMLIALTIYYASFIAESIYAGISAIDKGQLEAATVLGFKHYQILNLIVLPQVLHLIIPHIIVEYNNTVKSSSLGCAIGYPDLVAVFAGTALNQSGQALEAITMTMAFYLFVSTLSSLFIEWYHKKYILAHK